MPTDSKILRYLLGGLIIGGFWYLNRHRPPWEEFVRTVLLFSAAMILFRFRLRSKGIDVHVVPLIASKTVLVAIAALVEWQLERSHVAQAQLLVAIGLGLAVAIVGASADRFFFSRLPKTGLPRAQT